MPIRSFCRYVGVLLVWLTSLSTALCQYQPYAVQWLQKAYNPCAGRRYLGVTNLYAGSNVLFTAVGDCDYRINVSVPSPIPPMAAFWLSDGTNIFWTNTPPSEAWIGDGITKKIQLRTDGTANFTSNLTCKAQIITKDFSAAGNIVGGPSAVFYGNGAGLTNIPCCTNGAYTGSFTGDGSGLTNLNVQTNWDFTAITNAPWITNWYTQWDYTSITNAPWITNVTLTDLPSGVLTNQDTRIWTNLGGGLYATGAVCKLESGAANVLIVSNGFVGILRAPQYQLDVSGSERVSSDIVAGSSVQSGTYFGVNGLKVYINSYAKGTLTMGSLNGSLTNFYWGDRNGNPLGGTTNILLQQTVGATPTLSVLNTSNTGPANLIVAGSLTATNGLYYVAQSNSVVATNVIQPLHPFAAMMGFVTNTINGGANTYAIITNYSTARTNQMTCSLTAGTITNTIAGFYYCAVHMSMVALDAGALIEGDLLLDGVVRDEISFQTQFDPGTPRYKGASAFGILYLPANTQITFQVKSSGASGVQIRRQQLVVMPP